MAKRNIPPRAESNVPKLNVVLPSPASIQARCAELAAQFRQGLQVVDDYEFWMPIHADMERTAEAITRHLKTLPRDEYGVRAKLESARAIVSIMEICALHETTFISCHEHFAVLLEQVSDALVQAGWARP